MVELVVACCESIKICEGLCSGPVFEVVPMAVSHPLGYSIIVIETHLAEVTARSSPYDS